MEMKMHKCWKQKAELTDGRVGGMESDITGEIVLITKTIYCSLGYPTTMGT